MQPKYFFRDALVHGFEGKEPDYGLYPLDIKKFDGIYYLGWQDSLRINSVHRSVYTNDVSRDCKHWERKYRFETENSFQYPALYEYKGSLYFVIAQGDEDPGRKERIMFGMPE